MSIELHDLLVTSVRWLAGLTLGAFFGALFGAFGAAVSRLRLPLLHSAGFLRALPILGLAPLLSIYLGIGEISKVALIAWAAAFPIFISTVRSVSRRIPDLELRLMAARMPLKRRLRHYELPRLIGGFLNGVEVAIGIAWLSVVAAEYMIGTFTEGPLRGGLGVRVFEAFSNHDELTGVATLLILGALGAGTSMAWPFVARAIMHRMGIDREAVGA
jgi:sulfonate transport system permease protein